MKLTNQSRIVDKGWGREVIWADNNLYCGTFLEFKAGKKFSMHFHAEKLETWFVLSGSFRIYYINTDTAEILSQTLNTGDVWHNDTLDPHQLEALEDSVIIEVSTQDSSWDNYRVMPGDSQVCG